VEYSFEILKKGWLRRASGAWGVGVPPSVHGNQLPWYDGRELLALTREENELKKRIFKGVRRYDFCTEGFLVRTGGIGGLTTVLLTGEA